MSEFSAVNLNDASSRGQLTPNFSKVSGIVVTGALVAHALVAIISPKLADKIVAAATGMKPEEYY